MTFCTLLTKKKQVNCRKQEKQLKYFLFFVFFFQFLSFFILIFVSSQRRKKAGAWCLYVYVKIKWWKERTITLNVTFLDFDNNEFAIILQLIS